MRPTSLLSTAAAVALLAAAAGPAAAATAPVPARGVASSAATLLGVTAGGTTVTAGTLELLSDMLGAQAVARVLLTPVLAGGTPVGQQSVTPAGSPATAPAVSQDLLGLASLSSPVLRASASDADGQPTTSAGADSLGGAWLLGVPLSLDGSIDVGSVVTHTGGALATQEVVVEDVALPSVADVLAALGLDLSALPVEVLYELLAELDLVTDAVDTAQDALDAAVAEIQAQVDAAQAAVDAAEAELADALAELAGQESELAAAEAELATRTAALAPLTAAVTTAQGQLTAASSTLVTAQADVTSALGALEAFSDLLGVEQTIALLGEGNALVQALRTAQAAVTTATTAVTTATAAVAAATTELAQAQSLADAAAAAVTLLEGAVATLQTTIDGLQDVLDAALDVLDGVLDGVQTEVTALVGAITAVLDGTPLVRFDRLSILTRSAVTSSTAGGQSAEVVGGELTGLEVLGTDVLTDVLRLDSSSIELLDLVGSTLASLQSGIGSLTGTLSEVLSTVPGFPALDVPAPQIGLLTRSSSTGIEDGFGVASTAVKGLSITLPAITLPTALALPGAADLPALAGVDQVAGLLSSAPITLDLATLTNRAQFAPAVAGTATPTTGTPTTGTPTAGPPTAAPRLPTTGPSAALAALGVALMTAAVVARRRRADLPPGRG